MAAGFAAGQAARAGGSSAAGVAIKGVMGGIGAAGRATGSAAKEKAIGSPGAYAGSILGLANAKLDQKRSSSSVAPSPPERNDI